MLQKFLSKLSGKPAPKRRMQPTIPDNTDPNTAIYWDPKMAEALETWGEGNTWDEIQYLLVHGKGRVLDIACGTGKTIEMLGKFPLLEIHGCDLSDFLIQKAIDRGIPQDRLKVCDATQTGYAADAFEHSYSIGSLEHFTDQGITDFITEAHRITRISSFHMVPVARSGRDEGWMKTWQSFHNNSVEWWLQKYRASFPTVHVLPSRWSDDISIGKWFYCVKS